MIQYPTNVLPCNTTFDAKDLGFVSFIFNGDYMSDLYIRIYDYDTSQLVYTSWYTSNQHEHIAYNGYKLSYSIPANQLTNGHNYILEMVMCQKEKETGECIHDMPVLGGTVESSDNRSKVYVESDISSIYPLNEANGVYSPIAGNTDSMVIKINGESRTIKKYTARIDINGTTYGCIETAEPFSFDIEKGTRFEVYSNFLVTPQYYFSCRTTPNVSLSLSNFNATGISCTGLYSQSEQSLIKYYTLKLYWSNNSNFYTTGSHYKTMLISETDRIYSQKIDFSFWSPWYHDEGDGDALTDTTTDYYKVVCEIVTQDNVNIRVESNTLTKELNTSYQDETENVLRNFELTWDESLGCVVYSISGYSIYDGCRLLVREDLSNGEILRIILNGVYKGEDISAPVNSKYKYTLYNIDNDGHIILPSESPIYHQNFPTGVIEIKGIGYYITELNLQKDFDQTYHPNGKTDKKILFGTGDIWHFTIDIQDTTVTNNLDKTVHVGYDKYTMATATDVNYMSGTLSAMLGGINCITKKYDDDISVVKAWRKFITQQKPFMLKSPKGDVWIVNITESPTTSYQESLHDIPVTFSFSWAETYGLNDVRILPLSYTQNPV